MFWLVLTNDGVSGWLWFAFSETDWSIRCPLSASTVVNIIKLAWSALARKRKWFIASSKAFKKHQKHLRDMFGLQYASEALHVQENIIKTYTKCCLKKIKCFFSPGAEEWVYPVWQQQLYTVGCSSSCSWHKVSFRVRAKVSAWVSSQQLKAVMEKWTWSAWGL